MSRSTRTEWAQRVRRWKDSGLTAKEFGAETGLNPSTLSYWNWRLNAETRGTGGTRPSKGRTKKTGPRRKTEIVKAPAFVEVTARVEPAAATLEVLLGEDVRVRVPSGFDEATLTGIVRAVGAAR